MRALVHGLARLMAICGGLILIVLVALTCASILGRGLNTFAHMLFIKQQAAWLSQFIITAGIGPVFGDFELVEAGIAFAIFSFLPWCQLTRGHAMVDVFTNALPHPVNRFIDALSEILLSLVIVLICWRLFVGMQDKMQYGETTYLLQFPVWWAYAASCVAAATASLVAVYATCVRLGELITGQSVPIVGHNAEHAPENSPEQDVE